MKKYLAYALFFIFLFNSVGYFVSYFIVKEHIYSEVRRKTLEMFKPESLKTLSISQSQYMALNWTEEDEFLLNGKMYDVLKVNSTDQDHVEIVCYCDNDDSNLLAEMGDHFTKHNDLNSKSSSASFLMFFPAYCGQYTQSFSLPSVSFTETRAYSDPVFAPLLTISSPPPEV